MNVTVSFERLSKGVDEFFFRSMRSSRGKQLSICSTKKTGKEKTNAKKERERS